MIRKNRSRTHGRTGCAELSDARNGRSPRRGAAKTSTRHLLAQNGSQQRLSNDLLRALGRALRSACRETSRCWNNANPADLAANALQAARGYVWACSGPLSSRACAAACRERPRAQRDILPRNWSGRPSGKLRSTKREAGPGRRPKSRARSRGLKWPTGPPMWNVNTRNRPKARLPGLGLGPKEGGRGGSVSETPKCREKKGARGRGRKQVFKTCRARAPYESV